MISRQRIIGFAGWVVGVTLTLCTSFFAWLMPLFDITPRMFFVGCLIASLPIAWLLTRDE